MGTSRRAQPRRGSNAAGAFVVGGLLFLVVAGASGVVPPRFGQASELASQEAARVFRSDPQSTDEGARRFEGALLLSTPELEAAEPFVTLNRVTLTLPPAGAAGSVDGEFSIVLEIPGPVMYVNITGLGEAVGQAVGEAVSATTGVTAEQVERSGIEVPPEYDDCVFAWSIGGPLTGEGSTAFGGDGTVTTVVTGSGCEDTPVPGGQTTSVPSSWMATVDGEPLSGSIELVDEDGDVSELLFEATLAGPAESSGLVCPAVSGYEEGIGSGKILEAGSGDYQRALVCLYLSDGGGSFQISARWDWAEAPAGAGPTSCGLPPEENTRANGNRSGHLYSQRLAALVSWDESSPTGISRGEFATVATPLLLAAEALAVACPSGDSGGGAVITPVGGAAAGGGGGGDGDVIEGGGAFTDFVVGDDGFEVSREDAAAAAAAAAGVVVLTSLILVATSGAGGAETFTDALLDQLETGPPIGATVVDHPDFRQEGVPDAVVFDTDADGKADTIWTPAGGQVGPDTPIAEAVERLAEQPVAEAEPAVSEVAFDEGVMEGLEDALLGRGQRPPETHPGASGSSAELFDTDADGEFDTVHIDTEQDGVTDHVVRIPDESAPVAAEPEPVEEPEPALDEAEFEAGIMEGLEDSPMRRQRPPESGLMPGPEGLQEVKLFDTDADGEFDVAHIDRGADGSVDEVLGIGERSEAPSAEAAAPAEDQPPAEASADESEAAAASGVAPEAEGVAASGAAAAAAAAEAAPSGEAEAGEGEAAPPGPPPEMTAAELAELLRTSPKAKFLEEDDIKLLAGLVEDRRVEKVRIMPPFNKPIVKDVGAGWAKTDISLTNVSDTEGGVSLRLTGGVEIPVKVENGRVVLDVPDQMRRFTGAVDGYLEQLNKAFRTSGRQVEWIRKDDDSFIEIKTKLLDTSAGPPQGDGEWDSGEDPTDVPGGIGTTG